MKKQILFFLLLFSFFSSFSLKLDRVIVSTDANPMYMDFWPIVAQAWKEIVGIKPTLALIAPADVEIDESLGDVIRFEPIEGISTALQAQVIRLLLPILFKDEVCIISDIDMIPLSKSFYVNTIAEIPDDCFVVYKSSALPQYKQYAMCYNAAKGSVYGEIFGIDNLDDISDLIKFFAKQFNHAWSTDQQALYFYLNNWEDFETRCVKLGYGTKKRVDRVRWGYDIEKLKEGYYVDAHMLRPYKKFKSHNDLLLVHLGLED